MEPHLPDLSHMSSSELGRYGRDLHDHNRGSGVRLVLIARVLREALERRRHEEEGLGFSEWTRRYFGFGEKQALRRMEYGGHPLEPLGGKEVSHHQLASTAGCAEPVLSPLLANLEALSPQQITRIKRTGAAWVRQGKEAGEVAALVAQAAQGALALAPRRPRDAAALPSGKLGRGQVLRPLRGALQAVAVLRERRLQGEALGGTWPAELKDVMRALLWQVPELLGEDPAAFTRELLAERRAAPRAGEPGDAGAEGSGDAVARAAAGEEAGGGAPFPGGEIGEKGRADGGLGPNRALSQAGAAAAAPGAAEADLSHAGSEAAGAAALPAEEADGGAIEAVIGQLPEAQRAWLGERLFALLRGEPAEGVSASLRLLYEASSLCAADGGVSRARFDRWVASLCGEGAAGDGAAPCGEAAWSAAFDLLARAELPGFREQLYLLRTYPLGEARRARVLALCQAVALYPRGPALDVESAPTSGEALSPEDAELLRDGDDLRRLQDEIEAAWSDEAPLRLDVQSLLFEAEMELEKAVLGLGQERRRREAQGAWPPSQSGGASCVTL